MNSLFANIINERKRLFGLCGQTLVVPVRGCGGISAPKSRNNAKHKVGKANNFKFGDIGATFPMLCLKTRRYAVLICYALIFVLPWGGVRVAYANIISVSDGFISVGVGTELVTCSGSIGVTLQMPLGEIYRLALDGTPTSDADNRTATGNIETIDIIVPMGDSTIEILTEVTNPKGSIWLSESNLRTSDVSRIFGILPVETSPSIKIVQQPVGGASSGTLQTQPVVRLENGSNHPICDNKYVIKASVNNDTGTLTGTTEIQTNANGGVTYTDVGLSGAAETDHTIQFTLFRNSQEIGSTVLAAPIRYAAPADTTAPTLASSTPADDATGVGGDSNIVLTFSENIQAGTGNIVISDGTGDTRTIPVGDAQITIAGTTLTINPTADLNSSTSYYVQVAATAVDDLAGNSYAGITDTTTLNFTTADISDPTLASSNPADNATGVAVGSNIVLTFSENIQAGTGNIVISDGGSETRTIPVGDVQVTISGATLTINPSADLAYSTAYNVQIASTAIDDSAGNSYAGIANATTLNFTTAAAPPPPVPANVTPVANAGPDQTVESAAVVTLDGSGSSDADNDPLTYAWTQTSGTTVTLSSATAQQPTFTAPTLNVGDADAVLVFSLVVNDGTVNSVADTVTITVEAPAPTPASEFAEHEAEIRNTLVGDASRSLRSSVSANRRLAQSAGDRFVEFRQTQAREEDVTRALIPFDVDGNFTLSESGLNTSGNFFQQVGNEEGTYRRLFFGDFDVQHDADTDSTIATLTGRMAWEQMTSEQTMLGYFIGGELATSTIGGSFEGDQDRIGVTAGGYVVHELAEQVYFDGFASVGAGRNNLEMANDTLALESEYTTQTATLGGAITGVYSQKGYDFKPELAFSLGKTWLGAIGFTGRAYGLVDNTLSLDAGYVSIASLTFRPEVIIPIGADFVADTNTQLSFAPRLICEQIKSTTTTSDCGTGGELGFSSTSEDGLSSADMRILLDRVNGGTQSSFAFRVEHKF